MLVALGVLDLLVAPEIIGYLHDHGMYVPTYEDAKFYSTFYFCVAAPFLFIGVYKGWRGRVAWTGKAALTIGSIASICYLPQLIEMLIELVR